MDSVNCQIQTAAGDDGFIPAPKLRENELLEFIEKEFQKYDKSITPEAVQTLVYLVGDKIHDLKAEI